jgi:hypothetical protein
VTLALAGCTSQSQNLVGVGLPGGSVDSLLVPLQIFNGGTLDAAGNIELVDPEIPFDEHELLFFGNRGNESSAILVQYDFAAFRDTFPFGDLINSVGQDSIKVQLYLYLIKYYYEQFKVPFEDNPDTTRNLRKYYFVRELVEPLDPEQYLSDRPEELPGFEISPINPSSSQLVFAQSNIFITLNTNRFVNWFNAGFHNGLIVMEGVGIDPPDSGFFGFASKDFDTSRHSSNLALENINTTVGPVLHIEIKSPDDETIIANLLPMHDLSTLHRVDDPPDASAGILVRTHLRSYPYLSFSLAELPPNVFINRAVIGLINDTEESYGPLETIVVSEIDSSFAPTGDFTVDLAVLEDQARVVTGRVNLTPDGDTVVEFNISSSLQRYINGAFSEPLRYLFSAAEDFFPSFASGPDPSFFFQRFRFFGTGVSDPEKRPYLLITYTPEEALSGGGE